MSGNAIAELSALRGNLAALTGVPAKLAERGANRLTRIIRANTAAGLDAYGKPFVPLAPATREKGRQPPPMVASGDSLSETRARPLRGSGIAIVLGGAYMHHVRSHKTRPARSVIPERSGLPAAWNAALREEEYAAVVAACPALRGTQ
jgi:hypothetical protein